MDDVTDRITALAAHPPAAPRPVAEVRDAARRRHRRHRVVVAGAGFVTVALVGGFVAVAADGSSPSQLLRTIDEPATTTSVDPSGFKGKLAVSPSTGLRDGQRVQVTIPDVPKGTTVVFDTCASSGVSHTDTTSECSGSIQGPTAIDGPTLNYTARRSFALDGKRIDCAEPASPCILVAEFTAQVDGQNIGQGRYFAPLDFAAAPAFPTPTLVVEPNGLLLDGDPVTATGRGFAPREEVLIRLCGSNTAPTQLLCDGARGRNVTTDDAGSFSVRFLAYRDILTETWVPCTTPVPRSGNGPCTLEASGFRSGSATARVLLTPLNARVPDVRPAVEITTPGPHHLGQVVALRGSGFQPGGDVQVGNCAAPVENQPSACSFPDSGFNIEVGDDGTFTIPAFPLTDHTDCTARSGACVLGSASSEGATFTFATPLTLTR